MTLESYRMQSILIINGDQASCESLNVILQAEGFTVTAVHSGEESLALCEQGYRPDLILIADTLPGIDGLTTCRHLKNLLNGIGFSAVLLAEDTVADDRLDQMFAAGITDYLPAPVHRELLIRRVRQLLESQDAQNDLRIREAYRSVLEQAGTYIYSIRLVSGQPAITWVTSAIKAVTGYAPEASGFIDWARFVHPNDLDIVNQQLELLASGVSNVFEFRVCTKDGQILWIRNHSFPVVDETTGCVTNVYGAAKDITECKPKDEIFQQHKLELEKRNEDLDAFAYSVAHDLKNPISSMMGFASLVQKYFDRMNDDAVLEYLDLIIDEGYQLKEMINSLLVLAGVSKMREAEIVPLDMPAIVETVQRRLTMMLQESDAQIIKPKTWPAAAGYAPWVEEIWMNYISNAVKYGGKPPVIELGAERATDNIIRFWVRDNGGGLTRKEQKAIFVPFTRLSQVTVEGHGLGLSVVQRIAERLGGTVEVKSELGVGSKFSFTLPVAE